MEKRFENEWKLLQILHDNTYNLTNNQKHFAATNLFILFVFKCRSTTYQIKNFLRRLKVMLKIAIANNIVYVSTIL